MTMYKYVILTGIIAVGILCRLSALYRADPYTIDAGTDLLIARHITYHGEYVFSPTHPATTMLTNSPLYNFIVAGVYLVSPSLYGVISFFFLAGILTIIAQYILGSLIADHTAGAIAALLTAISPVLIHFSTSIWQPNLVPFFITSSFFCFLISYRNQSVRWMVCSIVLFFLALHIHLSVIALIPASFIGAVLMSSLYRHQKPLLALMPIALWVSLFIQWVYTVSPRGASGLFLFAAGAVEANPESGLSLAQTIKTNVLVFIGHTFRTTHSVAQYIAVASFFVILFLYAHKLYRHVHGKSHLVTTGSIGVLMGSALFITLWPAPIDYWNFAPFYPIALLLTAVALSRFLSFKKTIFKLLCLIGATILIANTIVIQPYEYRSTGTNTDVSLIMAHAMISDMNARYNDSKELSFHVIPLGGSWGDGQIWYMIERAMDMPLTMLVTTRGSFEPIHYPQGKHVNYLLCMGQSTPERCDEEVQQFLETPVIRLGLLKRGELYYALYWIGRQPS